MKDTIETFDMELKMILGDAMRHLDEDDRCDLIEEKLKPFRDLETEAMLEPLLEILGRSHEESDDHKMEECAAMACFVLLFMEARAVPDSFFPAVEGMIDRIHWRPGRRLLHCLIPLGLEAESGESGMGFLRQVVAIRREMDESRGRPDPTETGRGWG